MVVGDITVVGQGAVALELEWVYDTRTHPTAKNYFQCYRATATPAVGWMFSGWAWTVRTIEQPWGGSPSTTTQNYTAVANPLAVPRDSMFLGGEGFWEGDSELWFSGDDHYFVHTNYEVIAATATFVQIAPPPGPGIIYSPTRQGKIIYDLDSGSPMYYP